MNINSKREHIIFRIKCWYFFSKRGGTLWCQNCSHNDFSGTIQANKAWPSPCKDSEAIMTPFCLEYNYESNVILQLSISINFSGLQILPMVQMQHLKELCRWSSKKKNYQGGKIWWQGLCKQKWSRTTLQ